MLTETLLSTSGSSGRYLKLTPSSRMAPRSGQLGAGLRPGTTAAASWARLVYWKLRCSELRNAMKFALSCITKGTNTAVWKTFTMTRPATAGDTCDCGDHSQYSVHRHRGWSLVMLRQP